MCLCFKKEVCASQNSLQTEFHNHTVKTFLRNSRDAGFPLLTYHTPSAAASMLRLEKSNDGAHRERPTHSTHRRGAASEQDTSTHSLFIKVTHGRLQLSPNTPEGWNGKLISLDMSFKTEEIPS